MTKQVIFLVSFFILLAACGPQAEASDPTEIPTATATSLPTATDPPTATSTSTATPTFSPTPTETPIPCFTLLEPEDGIEIDRTMGQLTFAWTEQFGATSYRFAITIPSGYVEEKELTETSFERWLESLPLGGEYAWVVEAVDDAGGVLCTAGSFTFSKPAYTAPDSTKAPGGGDGDNGLGEGPPDFGD